MSEALMIIDAQSPWDDGNWRTVQAIQAALPAFRERMPIIWVFKTDDDHIEPTQLNGRALLDLFGGLGARNLAPSLHPRATDFVTTKKDMDAFSNPTLKPFLKELGIQNIYLAGFKASQCVYETGCGATTNDPLSPEDSWNVHLLLPLTADSGDELTHLYEDDFERQGIFICNDLETILGNRYSRPRN